MNIFTLIACVEITKNCNLKCAHCLRGDAKKSYISEDLLVKFFSEVKYFNTLLITGGEPFLCYDKIKQLINIVSSNCKCNEVEITTNGTIYDERIYNLLQKKFKKIKINISIDSYHIKSLKKIYSEPKKTHNPKLNPGCLNDAIENILINKNTPFFSEIYGPSSFLINQGRAKFLDESKEDLSAMGYFYSFYKKILLVGPIIYLDTNGYITDGNTEYNSRNKYSIGNIKKSSVNDIIINNSIKIYCNSLQEFYDRMNQKFENYLNDPYEKYTYKNNKIKKILKK